MENVNSFLIYIYIYIYINIYIYMINASLANLGQLMRNIMSVGKV